MNPPGKDGWEKSGVGRSEKDYGRGEGRGTERRARVEEVRRGEGYDSNGRGRKGDGKKGYVVYGEYVKVVEMKGKKVAKRREGRREDVVEHRKHGATVGTGLGEAQGQKAWKRKKGRRGRKGLEAKRARRVRRYETEVGRKVTRERVNRCEVREGRGRKRERGKRRRGRSARERTYREKSLGKAGEKQEAVYAERGQQVERVKKGSVDTQGAQNPRSGKEVLEGLDEERAKRRKSKGYGSSGTVRREAIAVVVVRGGVRRVERRRMKRRIRKREGAGRRHRRVRREWSRRRKAHGRKNKYGLRMSGVLAGNTLRGRESKAKQELRVQESETKPAVEQRALREEMESKRGKAASIEWGSFAEAVSMKKVGKSKGGIGSRAGSRKGSFAKRAMPGRRRVGESGLEEKKKVSVTRSRRYKGLRKALKKQLGGYYGYRVTVKGPLNGARRTTRRERGLGTVPGSLKSGRIGTAEGVAKTSVGTRGVQVAYCYGM